MAVKVSFTMDGRTEHFSCSTGEAAVLAASLVRLFSGNADHSTADFYLKKGEEARGWSSACRRFHVDVQRVRPSVFR